MWEENVDLLKKNGRLQNIDVEGQQHPAAGIFSALSGEKIQFSLYHFQQFTKDEQE